MQNRVSRHGIGARDVGNNVIKPRQKRSNYRSDRFGGDVSLEAAGYGVTAGEEYRANSALVSLVAVFPFY